MTTTATEGPAETPALATGNCGQYSQVPAAEVANATVGTEYALEGPTDLLSAVLERPNMQKAYDRVLRNKGAAGVDGMAVGDLKAYLQSHWPEHRQALLDGRYRPQPVRAVEIPKPGGGQRCLGIPTVLDRLIQQALHQVLSPLFEPTFSDHSYGFRPGRNAGQAVKRTRDYVEAGYRWVVDIDLEKFFDRVNHDILMSRVARRVKDKRVLKLIRRYLESGILLDGVVSARSEGTPQGGPLSPLLSNILLTDLDRELERRGHRFCRYADDCNIYVRSERAGQRVLSNVTAYLETRLNLPVNRNKSAVDRPWKRKFLGYSVCGRRYNVRLRVAPEVVKRFKSDVKAMLRRGRGQSLRKLIDGLNPKLRGWMSYFRHIGVKGILQELDGWLRRHLRKIRWRQWKRPRTRARQMMQLGLNHDQARKSAGNGRGAWWNAGSPHMNQAFPKKVFDWMGLVSLMDYFQQLNHSIGTAVVRNRTPGGVGGR